MYCIDATPLQDLSLDCLQQVVRAIYSTGNQRYGYLSELNLKLEELRWRLIQQRGWINNGNYCTSAACSTSWPDGRRLDEEPAETGKRMTPRQRRQACLIQAVASVENLFFAAGRARCGKSTRPDVEAWWMTREREIATLREELLSSDCIKL